MVTPKSDITYSIIKLHCWSTSKLQKLGEERVFFRIFILKLLFLSKPYTFEFEYRKTAHTLTYTFAHPLPAKKNLNFYSARNTNLGRFVFEFEVELILYLILQILQADFLVFRKFVVIRRNGKLDVY
jgi:hypothetical protein